MLMQCKINERDVSVVFDNRCNGLSQGLAKKIHNTAYLTINTVQQCTRPQWTYCSHGSRIQSLSAVNNDTGKRSTYSWKNPRVLLTCRSLNDRNTINNLQTSIKYLRLSTEWL